MTTWDEAKRLENIAKPGINLAELESVFDFPMVTVEDTSEDYGELRLRRLACSPVESSSSSGPHAGTTLHT